MKTLHRAYQLIRRSRILGLVLAVLCLALSVCAKDLGSRPDLTPTARRLTSARSSSPSAVPSALLSELDKATSQLRAECASSWSGHMTGSDACAWDITNLILAIDQDKTYVASNGDVGQALAALAKDLTTYSVRLAAGSGPVPTRVVADAQRVQTTDHAALTGS